MKRATALSPRQREVLAFLRDYFERNDQFPPVPAVSRRFLIWPNAVRDVLKSLARAGAIERNEAGKLRFKRERDDIDMPLETAGGHIGPRPRQALEFMVRYWRRNDQLPTVHAIAEQFDVADNAAWLWVRALEHAGHIESNEAGRYRFALEGRQDRSTLKWSPRLLSWPQACAQSAALATV